MLGFQWNLHLSNGFNGTRTHLGEWDTSLFTITDCQRPDRTGIQLDIKIIIVLTLVSSGTRHILAPKGQTSTFVYMA